MTITCKYCGDPYQGVAGPSFWYPKIQIFYCRRPDHQQQANYDIAEYDRIKAKEMEDDRKQQPVVVSKPITKPKIFEALSFDEKIRVFSRYKMPKFGHCRIFPQFLENDAVIIYNIAAPATMTAREVGLSQTCSWEEVFRACQTFAAKKGFKAGLPTCEAGQDSVNGRYFGISLIKFGAFHDIPFDDVNCVAYKPRESSAGRFRAVQNWAYRNGYVGGFPNFHQAMYDGVEVFGAWLFRNKERDAIHTQITDEQLRASGVM